MHRQAGMDKIDHQHEKIIFLQFLTQLSHIDFREKSICETP